MRHSKCFGKSLYYVPWNRYEYYSCLLAPHQFLTSLILLWLIGQIHTATLQSLVEILPRGVAVIIIAKRGLILDWIVWKSQTFGHIICFNHLVLRKMSMIEVTPSKSSDHLFYNSYIQLLIRLKSHLCLTWDCPKKRQ